MLAADFHSLSLHAIGRSIIGLHQVHHHDEAVAAVEEEEIDAFQNKVAHLFFDLAASNSHSSGEILSLPWLRSLLEVFVTCQDEFRILLMNNRSCLANQSLERLVGDFYERSVTALDVCNAVGDGIEQIREWKKVLEIVFEAIESGKWRRKNCQKKLGECQILRAKKALADLSVKMLQEDQNSFFPRNRTGYVQLHLTLTKTRKLSCNGMISICLSSLQLNVIRCIVGLVRVKTRPKDDARKPAQPNLRKAGPGRVCLLEGFKDLKLEGF